jgi:signal transduction histidine kinase
MSLKLSQQAFVLIGVPIAFELLFIAVLCYLLNNAELEAKQASHAKEVIAASEEIISTMVRGSLSLFLYRTTSSKEAGSAYEAIIGTVPAQFAALDELVKSDTRQSQALKRVEALADRELHLARAYKESLDTHDKFAYYMSLPLALTEIQGTMAKFITALREFESADVQSPKDALAREVQSRNSVRAWVAFGVLVNVAIAIWLAISFSKGTTARLTTIIDNIQRFAVKSPMHPQLSGGDELSHVDRVLHEMAGAVEAAQQKERDLDQMKQQFLATITHELHTPLTSLQAMLLMMKEGRFGELPEKVKLRAAEAGTSVHRLIVLIRELLDSAKIEAGKLDVHLAEIDLKNVLDQSIEAVRDYADHNQVGIAAQNLHSLPVLGDHDRLVQVFINLFSNAIKASQPQSVVRAMVDVQEEEVKVSISDSGSGIPKEQQPLIFDKYTHLQQGWPKNIRGTGLGLSICKYIIEAHRGQIGFESQEGFGTTFWLVLPLSARENATGSNAKATLTATKTESSS